MSILLLGSLAVPSRAQTINATTYPFVHTAGAALEDMSGGTTTLLGPNIDDSGSAVAAIGFEFWFVGVRYTQFSASSNGLVRLGPVAVTGTGSNNLASSGNVPQIAPYWDDVCIGTNGKVHFRIAGTAPFRRLIIEWRNMQVPRVGLGSAGAATFQCRLYESTGQIEFVYGSGMATNTVNGGASIGFGSAAAVFASITVQGSSVSYTVANNSNTDAIPAGTAYSFTPPVPSAPTGLSFSGVSAISMTLSWTDAASNEIGYVLYRSLDGSSYTFVTQQPANTTSWTQTGLSPSTTYYWRIQAVSEGGLSSSLEGAQSTSAPGNISTTGSGAWSSTVPDAPWPGGIVPTSSDDVTIGDGHTVTIDAAAACLALTVGQGTSGVLQFEDAVARTLSVGGDLHISSGAILRSAGTGSQTGHVLSVGGSVTNDGTLDLSTNGDAAGARVTFTGSGDAFLSGNGPVTDLRVMTLNKGPGWSTTLTLDPAAFSVQGLTTSAPGFLTLTSGTLRVSGSFSMTTALFGSANYFVGANGGIWIDNPNFQVLAQAGSPSLGGLLRISAGTYNIGTTLNNSLGLSTGCTVMLEGGTLNVAGRFSVTPGTSTALTYVQTGGTLTANTVGQSSTTFASFDLGTSASAAVTMSGGNIILQNPSAAASGPRDFRNSAGIQNITGGTLQLGNELTPAAGTFYLSGTAPGLSLSATPYAQTAVLYLAATASGASVLQPGTTLNLNGNRFTQANGNLINQGTIIGTTGSSELYFKGAAPQTYSGQGVITNPLRGAGLSVDNPAGLTIDPAIPRNIRTLQVNLIRGILHNSQLITLGDSLAAAVTQIGAAGLSGSGGAYDTWPALHPLMSGLSVVYLQEGTSRTPGYEIPASRSVKAITINNSNGVILSGGGLTVSGSLTLTSGNLSTTSANLLTLANAVIPPPGSAQSYVDGPLGVQFQVSSATNRTYAIGAQGAFRPLTLKSVNTRGLSQVFAAQVIPGPTGGSPQIPLVALTTTRYWKITNAANPNAAARVNLTFGPDDNVGTLSAIRVAQSAASNGTYVNLGGATTGDQTAGTVESTSNLTPGSGFFAIGSTSLLASTWDGGAGTSNWGDANNWNPNGVPTSATNVSLVLSSPTTINVNGAFSAASLTLGGNTAVMLGTGSLSIAGAYNQTAGSMDSGSGALTVGGTANVSGGSMNLSSGTVTSTGAFLISGGSVSLSAPGKLTATSDFTLSSGSIALGSGTLEIKGSFSRSGGTFDPGTGSTIFSGTGAQNIGGDVSHYNLILRNGGSSSKKLAAGRGFTVNNDFTVEGTAQLALSIADDTYMDVWGNFNYSGLPGAPGSAASRSSSAGPGSRSGEPPSSARSAPRRSRGVLPFLPTRRSGSLIS